MLERKQVFWWKVERKDGELNGWGVAKRNTTPTQLIIEKRSFLIQLFVGSWSIKEVWCRISDINCITRFCCSFVYQRLKYWCTSILSWGPLTLEEFSGILKTQVSSHIDMIFTTMPTKPVFQQNRQFSSMNQNLPYQWKTALLRVVFFLGQTRKTEMIGLPHGPTLDISWAHQRFDMNLFWTCFFQETGRISKGTTARSNHVSSTGWSL